MKIRTMASFAILCASVVTAQEVSATNPNQTVKISFSAADKTAAASATSRGKQFLPPKPTASMPAPGKRVHPRASSTAQSDPFHFQSEGAFLPRPGYFVTDVSYNGGQVVTDAINYPVYVNTTPDAVGYPGTLLRDLGKSEMVHVIDQYVGLSWDNRYKAGVGASLTYPTTPNVALQDADVYALVHAAAAAYGKSGYHTVFHIFLPAGQDVCSGGSCYSPDNLATFGFCAYHDSVDFDDVGHVLYSLEPYQAVTGCQTGPPSPNGLVIDSTMDTLSHEFFETISDPDGDAWWNINSLDEFGEEIGDICVTTSPLYPIVKLNGTKYELQGEYSNTYHGCVYRQ